MSQTCLFISVVAVLGIGLFAWHFFSRYFKYSGIVVAHYAGGSLVNTMDKVVFVANPNLDLDQKVKLRSPNYPPFKKHLEENPHRSVYIDWALLDRDGDTVAVLIRRLNFAQWIAIVDGREIFVDLDNDEDYHFVDVVRVVMSPQRIKFEEYCLTD